MNTDENSGDFANAGTQHGSQQIARAQYVTTDATQQTKVRTNIQSSMTIKSQWDGGIRREYVNSHEYIYIYIICIYNIYTLYIYIHAVYDTKPCFGDIPLHRPPY